MEGKNKGYRTPLLYAWCYLVIFTSVMSAKILSDIISIRILKGGILYVWLLLLHLTLTGGEGFHYQLFGMESVSKPLRIKEEMAFSTLEARDNALESIVPFLRSAGYIEASADSIAETGDTMQVYFHLGTKYEVIHQVIGDTIPAGNGKKNKAPSMNQAWSSWSLLTGKLSQYANAGFPFARMYNKSLDWKGDTLLIVSAVERGPLVTFDSLVNKGSARINKNYLYNYLGIKPGQPFSEKVLKEAEPLLSAMPFARYQRPPKIYFRQNKADIWLYQDKRKLSRFDFLIGILPNNQQTGKVMITGEAGLQLYNAFGRGEQLKMDWRKLQGSSQQLNLMLNFPYILRSPIGTYATFRLDKRDTSHLNINWKIGIPYTWKGGNYLRAFIDNQQTIVISPDTNYVKATMRLPAVLDANSLLYGLECSWSNVDYIYNPTKGIMMYANLAMGTKKLKENNSITNLESPSDPGFDYASLYDSLGRKTLKGNLEWELTGYLPFAKRHVIKLETQGKCLINKNLLDNELHRIGGSRLLRGFDEESIQTSVYNVATLEYRFLLDKNAFFNVFLDAAYSRTKTADDFKNDFPFGFGAGVTFETKGGIFGVNYAMGRQLGNAIDFRSAKLHFGYVNIF